MDSFHQPQGGFLTQAIQFASTKQAATACGWYEDVKMATQAEMTCGSQDDDEEMKLL